MYHNNHHRKIRPLELFSQLESPVLTILFNRKYNVTEQLKAQLQKFLEYKVLDGLPLRLVKDARKDETKKDKISRNIQ